MRPRRSPAGLAIDALAILAVTALVCVTAWAVSAPLAYP